MQDPRGVVPSEHLSPGASAIEGGGGGESGDTGDGGGKDTGAL